MLFGPSGKGQKRQKKGEKGRFRPISRKDGQTPLKPPFVTPPFAAAQSRAAKHPKGPNLEKFKILKFSGELEIFKRATHQSPIFCGEFWRSGLKISSDLEFFQDLGP